MADSFYDFFNLHELGALNEEEARQMLRRLSERAGTPRVVKILEEEPGRFKALLLLSGGTPRTLAMLHGILALEGFTRAEEDLEALLDQLTPYYKARFDDLPARASRLSTRSRFTGTPSRRPNATPRSGSGSTRPRRS